MTPLGDVVLLVPAVRALLNTCPRPAADEVPVWLEKHWPQAWGLIREWMTTLSPIEAVDVVYRLYRTFAPWSLAEWEWVRAVAIACWQSVRENARPEKIP